jgi:PhzF family phenazine biosynthesis protein
VSKEERSASFRDRSKSDEKMQSEDTMRKAAFFLVDVFSDRPLEGNPLAVVPDADQIDEATMRRIAREFNQAETTFLLAPAKTDANWLLRSFTPAGQEVFGAGHNALGAWWWLASSGRLPISGDSQQFHQQIGDSVLPVTVFWKDGEVASIEMRQSAPVFGKTVSDSASLAEALGLALADVALDGLEAQVVSTGAAHLLVPVRDRLAIERATPDTAKLLSVLRSAEGEGCYLFCLDVAQPGSTAHARFFNPTMGIAEDAATGTAAGPLAALLVAKGIVADGSSVAIEQGYAMDRPSLIRIGVHESDVRISGRGFVTAEGFLRLA